MSQTRVSDDNVNLSIIVLYYNSDRWLKSGLDSLNAQTLKNIEIIIVDDGSCMKSSCLVQEHVNMNNNIKLIRQENKGGLLAFINALTVARGKYITLFDIDDTAESNMYEIMFTAAIENNADIIECKYDVLFGEQHDIRSIARAKRRLMGYKEMQGSRMYSKEYILSRYLTGVFSPMLWRRLFSLDVAKKALQSLQSMIPDYDSFLRHVMAGDELLLPLFLAFTRNYFVINNVLYHYHYMAAGSYSEGISGDSLYALRSSYCYLQHMSLVLGHFSKNSAKENEMVRNLIMRGLDKYRIGCCDGYPKKYAYIFNIWSLGFITKLCISHMWRGPAENRKNALRILNTSVFSYVSSGRVCNKKARKYYYELFEL